MSGTGETGEAAFRHVIEELQPALVSHGFSRTSRWDGHLSSATGTSVVFGAGDEAVRLTWDFMTGRSYVVLEALEPELGFAWGDMRLKFIDPRTAPSAELADLVEILSEELEIYFRQIGR